MKDLGKSLAAWITCLKLGGHAFDEDGACTRCSARRGGPSFADLMTEFTPAAKGAGIDPNWCAERLAELAQLIETMGIYQDQGEAGREGLDKQLRCARATVAVMRLEKLAR